jgi:predicted transcriptional regulator
VRWGAALVVLVFVATTVQADGTTVDLSPQTSSKQVSPGGSVVFPLTLRNLAPTSQTFLLSHSGAGSWNVTLSRTTVTLPASQTTNIDLTVRVPANASVGVRRTLGVTARNSAITSDADNVTADVTVSSPSSSTTPSPSSTPSSSTPTTSPTATPDPTAPTPPTSANPSPTPSQARETPASTDAARFEEVRFGAPGADARVRGPGHVVDLAAFVDYHPALAWAAVTWTVSFSIGLVMLHESARLRLRLLLLSLFSRLERDRVLDHGLRERIFESIRREPGLHYGGLRRALGVPAGTLAHHLVVLERQELVRSARDGFRKRYYPRGRADWGPAPLDAIQRSIIDLVRARPGIHQRAIASQLGVSKQVVHYHVGRLSSTGRLLVEREGRLTHCYPARP